MKVIYKEISKDHFDYLMTEFLPILDGTFSYLYVEFEYTFQFFVSNAITDDSVVVMVKTDHDLLTKKIEDEFYKNDDTSNGRIIYYSEDLDNYKWLLVFGGSNGNRR